MKTSNENLDITRCLEQLAAIQPHPGATEQTIRRVRRALLAQGLGAGARNRPRASLRARIRKVVTEMGLMRKVAAAVTLAVLLVASGWAAQEIYHAVQHQGAETAGQVEIAGKVVDAKTGKPVEQFVIQMGWFDAKEPSKVNWGGGVRASKWTEGEFHERRGEIKGTKVWFRIVADGYLPEPVTPEPMMVPAAAKDLVVRLKRGNEVKGIVLDHTGKPVPGAKVYLGGNLELDLYDGQDMPPWQHMLPPGAPGGFPGTKTVTDKDGRFTMAGTDGAKDRLIVAAEGLVWLAPPQPGKEQTIQLPQPGQVSIAYDIEGAAKEGLFRLELKTWEMPDWKDFLRTERRVKCANGQGVVIDLTPGEYDVCRLVEGLPVGGMLKGAFCDRGSLRVEGGKTAKLEFIRSKGSPVSGQVIGLQEAKLPVAFITVRPEKATGAPLSRDEWKLPIYDALTTSGADAEFKTCRLLPGTYTVIAEAYTPESSGEMRSTGRGLPSMIGTAKVTVPESGEPKPIRIELKPLPPRSTQPTTRSTVR